MRIWKHSQVEPAPHPIRAIPLLRNRGVNAGQKRKGKVALAYDKALLSKLPCELVVPDSAQELVVRVVLDKNNYIGRIGIVDNGVLSEPIFLGSLEKLPIGRKSVREVFCRCDKNIGHV